MLTKAARSTEGVLPKPEPFVLIRNLDNNFVAYEINAYTEKPNELIAAYSRLMEQILNAFGDAGIEILSPQHVALRDSTPTSGPTVCMRCPQNQGRTSFGDDYLTVIQDVSLRSASGEGV